jgi:hypothetical protein
MNPASAARGENAGSSAPYGGAWSAPIFIATHRVDFDLVDSTTTGGMTTLRYGRALTAAR